MSRGRSKDLFHYLSENASLEYVRVSVVRVQISKRGSEIRLVEETTGIGGSIESFSQLLLYILSFFPSDASLNAKTTCELRRRYDDFCTVNLTRTTDRPFSFLLFRVRRRDAPFSLPFGRGRSGLNCEATANESDHKSKARPDHGPRPRERASMYSKSRGNLQTSIFAVKFNWFLQNRTS